MKMQFHHAGRQFFFITTAIERQGAPQLSFDARQLKAIRRYIRLNPARALWKARHPDRFIRFANIRHPVLDPARRWDAMGNLTLLASPFLHHVRLTMRKTAEEHAAEIDSIMERAVCGLVPVSGFPQGTPDSRENLRARCNIMNSLAAALCSKAAEMA